ncbi:MAG: hypothetical protein KC912_03760 [Proteobacteria bacterium]|nr:hypothetical protein [Pseudomonadota bacterium]
MSDWHYCRTIGADGGVDAVEGRAYGLDFASILNDGLPPFKIALEVIAGLCEILDIAEQDDEGHGDMLPSDVFLDETGAISIEGFGGERGQTTAPEGRPGYASDLWGLGYVAFRLFSPTDLGDLPSDPDEYDDAIIDAVLAINFDALPEEWVGDVQWYLAKLMSWEPDDRPQAVDVWRTFVAFADEMDGVNLADWGGDALDGGGVRRDADGAIRDPAELAPPSEDLGGAISAQGPLARGGGIDFSGGQKQGQATAFWSRDAMKAALANEPDEEEVSRDPHLAENQPYRPQAGGGSSTSFWSLDQMKAMADGGDGAPRPKRRGKAGERSSARQAPAAAPPPGPSGPVAGGPVAGGPVAGGPVAGGPVAGGPIAGGPIAGGPVAGGPIAGGPVAAPPVAVPADSGGGKGGLIAGGVVAVFSLLCLLGALAGGGYWYSQQGATEGPTGPAPAPVPTTPKDTGGAEPEPEPEPEPAPAPAPRPKPKPKPRPSPSPSPSPKPTPRPAPAPAPAPAPTGILTVNVRTPGLAFISCGDGQKAEIDGSLAMEFDGHQAPISCMIIDDASNSKWSGQFNRSGTARCSIAGGSLSCKAP